MVLTWLARFGIYGALVAALIGAGYGWGKYDTAKKTLHQIEEERAAVQAERIEAAARIQQAEDAAAQERRKSDDLVRRLKKADPSFAQWYDTPVPAAAVGIVRGNLPDPSGRGPVPDPASAVTGDPGRDGQR